MDQQSRPPSLPALTGLRFGAALWVVCHHYGQYYLVSGPWRTLASAGAIGVTCFFVLSGFILAYTGTMERGLRTSWAAFWWARVARVYPLYLFALLMAAPPLLWISGAIPSTGQILASLSLTQAWTPAYQIVWNSPSWSLSAEALFYAVFPFVAWVLLRVRTSYLLLLLPGAWLASLLLAFGAASHDAAGWLIYFPPARLPEFIIGVALGILFRRHGALRSRGLIGVLCLPVLVLALLGTTWLPLTVIDMGLFAPLFGLLIYDVAGGAGPLAWLCSTRICARLGEASYAVYLLHVPLWAWGSRLMGPNDSQLVQRPLFFAAYVIVVIGVALLAYRLVETPSRRWLRRFGQPASPYPAVAT